MKITLRAGLLTFWTFGAVFLGLGPATARAVRADDPLKERCYGASTQAETLACYLKALKKSQMQLERAFNKSVIESGNLDKKFHTNRKSFGSPRPFLAQLKISQSAWRSYSKLQCSFEGSTSFGGSGTDILEAACHYRLNALRLAELRANDRLLNR